MTRLVSRFPGRWRRNAIGETSQAAAKAGDKPTLRQLVLDEIEASPTPLIPERILDRLTSRGVRTVLTSVRPRCSELARLGLIEDSGLRERGEGGCRAIAWRATDADTRAKFSSEADHG